MPNQRKVTTLLHRYTSHECCDKCEHVWAGEEAVVVYVENDSFGPVLWMALCQTCEDETKESYSYHKCVDCGERVKNKDLRQWRWYDFIASEGDEPLHICASCWDEPKHKDRMRRDSILMDEEYSRYNSY